MAKTRDRGKRKSAEEKVDVLRKHLLENVSVVTTCETHGIKPSTFYSWQKQFFENGAAAFTRPGPSREEAILGKKVEQLEARLREKDAVIALVSEEYVKLKKELGEL